MGKIKSEIILILEKAVNLSLNLYNAKGKQLYATEKNQWFVMKDPTDYLLEAEGTATLKIGRYDELYVLLLLKDSSKLLVGPFIFHRTNEKEKPLKNPCVLVRF